MNQYENIKKYAKNCISGEIISCKKHKWACERFLKDAEQFENNPDYHLLERRIRPEYC